MNTKPPTPEEIENVLKQIDHGDVPQTQASYAEGIRVGIMWATGQIETNPLD